MEVIFGLLAVAWGWISGLFTWCFEHWYYFAAWWALSLLGDILAELKTMNRWTAARRAQLDERAMRGRHADDSDD